jgi:atypical dual specificity phosphatase
MAQLPRPLSRLLFYPTLLWNMLLGRWLGVRHWWDRIDDHVILGALPFASDVPKLAAEGVRAVVNTCEEYAGPVEQYAAAGIRQLRIPTTDFHPPTLADIERAVEFMRESAARGETVYVHCKAGRARSATVVVCWLVATHGLSPAEAQQFVLARRPHVLKTVAEREVVRQFAASAGS